MGLHTLASALWKSGVATNSTPSLCNLGGRSTGCLPACYTCSCSRFDFATYQALVDGKNFSGALRDFEAALGLTPGEAQLDQARLLAGQALAHEGLAQWPAALDCYDQSLGLAAAAG